MADSILYYPHISLRDLAWVKSSLLLWDKIYRIVPQGNIPTDHAEVRPAVAEGFVRDLKLEREDLQQVAIEFSGLLESVHNIPDGLDVAFDQVHPDKID